MCSGRREQLALPCQAAFCSPLLPCQNPCLPRLYLLSIESQPSCFSSWPGNAFALLTQCGPNGVVSMPGITGEIPAVFLGVISQCCDVCRFQLLSAVPLDFVRLCVHSSAVLVQCCGLRGANSPCRNWWCEAEDFPGEARPVPLFQTSTLCDSSSEMTLLQTVP